MHAELGLLLAAKSNDAGARQAFNRALELDPFQLDALNGLTALDLAAQHRVGAMSRLDDLVIRAPRNPGLLVLAARACMSVNDLSRAETLLVRAIEADPGALTAYSLLGTVYLSQNRMDAALAEFETLAAGQDRPVGALTVIGMIYQVQNRIADARRQFERVVSLDANAAVASNNLAWIYAENGGSLESALQLAQTAKQICCGLAQVLFFAESANGSKLQGTAVSIPPRSPGQ